MTTVEEFCQHPVSEDGEYRVFPVAWTIEASTKDDSKSVAIAIRLGVAQKWHGKEQGWSVEWPVGYFVEHRAWVVKKDGEVNQGAVDALAKCGLWNGDWDALAGDVPSGFYLIASVTAETYEGKTRFRANWLNPNADEPVARGGFAPVDTTLLAGLRARFQGKTRAIASTAGKPAGAPPPPPVASAAVPPLANAQPQAAPVQAPPPAAVPQQAAPPPQRPAPGVSPQRPSAPPQSAPRAPTAPGATPAAGGNQWTSPAVPAPSSPATPPPPQGFGDPEDPIGLEPPPWG